MANSKKTTKAKKTSKATKEKEVIVETKGFKVIHEPAPKQSKPELATGENAFLVNRMNGLVDENNNPL